jgi:trans-2,3-dihydro-3-hydroxyanthranilate isomerase
MTYQFYWCDVFTNQLFGGNPLVVFPDAQGISTDQMQKIAKEFNISETVFVFPPHNPKNNYRLRIFTPGGEIPFAGHPTVGTAHVLAAIAHISIQNELTKIILEEQVGEIPVTIVSKNGKPVYTQLTVSSRPEIGPPPPSPENLANLLSLETGDLLVGEKDYPQAISCGLPFLLIPLTEQNALKRAQLKLEVWQKLLAEYWAPHIYLFTYDNQDGESDHQIRARMFAPKLGIDEDPATGSAASVLAAYLALRQTTTDGTLTWEIKQGIEMGRPSSLQIEVEKKNGQIAAIRVGGASILVSQGTLLFGF